MSTPFIPQIVLIFLPFIHTAAMSLLQSLLHLTNFKSPLLQTLVPSVSAVFAIQTAFAIPSIAARSDRFYDFSGALTYVAVTTLSLYLPALRARYAAPLSSSSKLPPLPSLLAPFRSGVLGGGTAFNWRQVVLTGAVSLWATRCERFSSPLSFVKRDS